MPACTWSWSTDGAGDRPNGVDVGHGCRLPAYSAQISTTGGGSEAARKDSGDRVVVPSECQACGADNRSHRPSEPRGDERRTHPAHALPFLQLTQGVAPGRLT